MEGIYRSGRCLCQKMVSETRADEGVTTDQQGEQNQLHVPFQGVEREH